MTLGLRYRRLGHLVDLLVLFSHFSSNPRMRRGSVFVACSSRKEVLKLR